MLSDGCIDRMTSLKAYAILATEKQSEDAITKSSEFLENPRKYEGGFVANCGTDVPASPALETRAIAELIRC